MARNAHGFSGMHVRRNTRDEAHQRERSQERPASQAKSATVGAGISTEGAQEIRKAVVSTVLSIQYSVLGCRLSVVGSQWEDTSCGRLPGQY